MGRWCRGGGGDGAGWRGDCDTYRYTIEQTPHARLPNLWDTQRCRAQDRQPKRRRPLRPRKPSSCVGQGAAPRPPRPRPAPVATIDAPPVRSGAGGELRMASGVSPLRVHNTANTLPTRSALARGPGVQRLCPPPTLEVDPPFPPQPNTPKETCDYNSVKVGRPLLERDLSRCKRPRPLPP